MGDGRPEDPSEEIEQVVFAREERYLSRRDMLNASCQVIGRPSELHHKRRVRRKGRTRWFGADRSGAARLHSLLRPFVLPFHWWKRYRYGGRGDTISAFSLR
jgi:hypothetical protein